MATITAATVAGNLTRDPEIRYTREGQATTSLSVAVNRRWQNQQTKEWEESVSFLDVVCWRDLADRAGDLVRGDAGDLVDDLAEARKDLLLSHGHVP